MSSIFRKGDLVQLLQGGPVMTVMDVREEAGGDTVVETAPVHGDRQRVESYPSTALKVIGSDADDDLDDGDSDDDQGD